MEKTKETKSPKAEKQNVIEKSKQAILNAMDENGNGEIDIEDVIIKGLRIPGIKIDRANFLQKELFKKYSQEVIDKAISTTPAQANISDEDIEKISEEVIQFERVCVSGISTAWWNCYGGNDSCGYCTILRIHVARGAKAVVFIRFSANRYDGRRTKV